MNEELSYDNAPKAGNKEPQDFEEEEEVVAWVDELETMAGVAENEDIEEELAVTKEDPAVTKEELASNKDILEVNEHIPAESSSSPDPKDISTSCKNILPNKHIIFAASEVLSMCWRTYQIHKSVICCHFRTFMAQHTGILPIRRSERRVIIGQQ